MKRKGKQNKTKQKYCPWFSEEGSVYLKTQKCVGESLKPEYHLRGPSGCPIDGVAL